MESATTATAPNEADAADRKVLGDLDILLEKMDRSDDLLRPGGTFQERVLMTEEVMDVIGFLEACAPRMIELVEAAAQGALSEPVLMKCLEVNDRLTKNLADIDAVNFVEEEEAPAIQQRTTEDDFDAFLNERTSGAAEDLL